MRYSKRSTERMSAMQNFCCGNRRQGPAGNPSILWPKKKGALGVVAGIYGSFLLADHFGLSGVLATVSAGFLMGNLGVLREEEQGPLSSRGRDFVMAFWEFAAFIANSLIFLLIGLTVAGITLDGLGLPSILIIVILVLVGRALTVYPLCLLFRRTRWAIPNRDQHILWWGGLR